MGEFKKGAFRMALDLDVPILPITILGTGKILPPKTRNLFPGRAKLIIHPPLSIESYDIGSIEELMDAVREVIQVGIDTRKPASTDITLAYRGRRSSFQPNPDAHHHTSAHEKGPGE
jgi:1-acyl-sn-glycerol-3-phosphate acyltransferase